MKRNSSQTCVCLVRLMSGLHEMLLFFGSSPPFLFLRTMFSIRPFLMCRCFDGNIFKIAKLCIRYYVAMKKNISPKIIIESNLGSI